jgi:hypothetical protein
VEQNHRKYSIIYIKMFIKEYFNNQILGFTQINNETERFMVSPRSGGIASLSLRQAPANSDKIQ